MALPLQDAGSHGPDTPCPWAESSAGGECQIGCLQSHAHFLVARAPGKAGIWLFRFFGERLALLPLLTQGMGNTPNTERGSAFKSNTLSMPVTIILSPGFLLMDICNHSPELEGEAELLVPDETCLNTAQCHRHSHPDASQTPRMSAIPGWPTSQRDLASAGEPHSWLTSSAFVGWRKRETGRVRMSTQPGKGVRKMFLMCIRLCSQARGLCPASRHVPA